ncbi:phospho-N-acetylmuramoyl-pentapeptide-transferase [Egicoccus halophilus]|uniref:Phospho-N-acetylmuramoyl-pentapeptide-transferase n=1 Tax=Egicoccus halophilus TaxID=1670830 RepID=A0A8J3A8E7_9ACTN|nr:phospho-N-acetylmuramoyl-pentapeptide-transferase [Egicoccus halophilus]GGI04321.1 phospho-N-acetylmuramoyl-pentapeptide-transferase [Egicoccus halophilus]
MIAILISGTVALVAALAGTPLVITYFRERGFGQFIREEGPEAHHAKAGTPTMGGTAIVLAAVLAFLTAHLTSVTFTPVGWLVVFVFVGMAAVGFADDFIKLRMQRNLGLNKTAKFLGQAVIAAVFAFAGPALADLPTNISIVGALEIQLPNWAFFLWIFLLLAGASNAVNLTDGLDGLAAGSGALVFGAYTLIAFWQFRNPFAYPMESGEALDVAIIVAAVMAACAGFLWHNAPPARIFMGDTGSLALGGLLAAVSVVTNTQVLLVLLGGLYVLETLSVIIQVAVFRSTGRRVFRMAPMHHHFELLGWQETTIIVRFWIIAGIGVALGLGTFYAEYLSRFGPLG